MGRPAVIDELRPPSTPRQDHADIGPLHGQDAIRAMEGEGVGHPAELECSKSANGMILVRVAPLGSPQVCSRERGLWPMDMFSQHSGFG